MNKLSTVLVIVFCWVLYSFWFGKNNIFDYFKLKDELVEQKNINEQLRQRNEKMFAEINNLTNEGSAVEERARSELGMIKAGEHFYRILYDSPKPNTNK